VLDLGCREDGGTLNAFCQKLNENVRNMWSGIVTMKHPVSKKLRLFSSDVMMWLMRVLRIEQHYTPVAVVLGSNVCMQIVA
jgi:hypothetical protein